MASGSSGNATYVGANGQHFLVDAGISGKRIEQALLTHDIKYLNGIFITHDHSDHIQSAGVMARRHKINLYATEQTWRFFLRHNKLGAVPEEHIKIIESGKPINLGGVIITAFDVSHDGVQPVGYVFESGGSKAVVATDLGVVTDNVKQYLTGSNILVIECNHDVEMLENGPYHRDLKDRIAQFRGHLSNVDCGTLISEIACERLKYVVLAHLSENNNMPWVAFDTVKRILDAHSVSLEKLMVAYRHDPSEMIVYGE